jgi:hypothetical protein
MTPSGGFTFHGKRKGPLRTLVRCPHCEHEICVRGTQIPLHRDVRFGAGGRTCSATGLHLLEAAEAARALDFRVGGVA